MIDRDKLVAMRADMLSQRDQAVGALFILDHLIAEWDKPDAMTTQEFAEMMGGKLMREPEPLEKSDDGKDGE